MNGKKIKKRSMFQLVFLRLMENKSAMTGLIVICLILLLSFVLPPLSRYGVNEMNLDATFLGASLWDRRIRP